MHKSALLGVVSLTATLMASTALAQRAPVSQVEEVVVTAQRRTENLQNVPVTVTAMSASQLQARGVTGTQALQTTVPGLNNNQVAGNFMPYIRGVGSNQTGSGNESSVAVYIDGQYMGAKPGNIMDLGAIERVEVLKGPQGTLFGRNATGGALSITTLTPPKEFQARAEASYSRFAEKRVVFYGGGPITDTLAASLSYTGKWNHGYTHDVVRNVNGAPVENQTGMVKLQWTPTDQLSVTLSGQVNFLADPTYYAAHTQAGTISSAEAAGFFTTHAQNTTSTSFQAFSETRQKRALLNISYDFGKAEFVSITGYLGTTTHTGFDLDMSPRGITHLLTDQNGDQFSQEFHLRSNTDGPLTWITGAYYIFLREGYAALPHGQTTQVNVPFPVRPADLLVTGASVTGGNSMILTTSYSAFAQGTYAFNDTTRLTAGLRFTRDLKSMRGRSYRLTAAPGNAANSVPLNGDTFYLANDGLIFIDNTTATAAVKTTWKKPTWRLALDHDFTDDIMGYASYSRGFKSGSYAPLPVSNAQPVVNPEQIDAYEVGLKTEWFDRRVRVNVSAYYYDYKDIQVALVTSAGVSVVQNAAAARIYGFDFDGEVILAPGLTAHGGFNLINSKYKDYQNSQLLLPKIVAGACPALRTVSVAEARAIAGGTPVGGNCNYILNASGLDVLSAPRNTFSLGLDYDIPLGNDSRLLLTGNAYHNSGYDVSPGGFFTHIPAYETISASATWFAPDDRYFVRVWGDNLTNDIHPVGRLPLAFVFQEVDSKPRTYGVTIGFKFGG